MEAGGEGRGGERSLWQEEARRALCHGQEEEDEPAWQQQDRSRHHHRCERVEQVRGRTATRMWPAPTTHHTLRHQEHPHRWALRHRSLLAHHAASITDGWTRRSGMAGNEGAGHASTHARTPARTLLRTSSSLFLTHPYRLPACLILDRVLPLLFSLLFSYPLTPCI